MFKLLRRISSSVYPRNDRPWSDDATSNAPTIGKKRRMDDDEDESMEAGGSTRKRRGQIERSDTDEFGMKPAPKETDPDVKEMTKGVKQVELEDKEKGDLGERTDAAEINAEEAANMEETPQTDVEAVVETETTDKGKGKATEDVVEGGAAPDATATNASQDEARVEEATPIKATTPPPNDEVTAAAAIPIPGSPERDPETSSMSKEVEHLEHTEAAPPESATPADSTEVSSTFVA